MCASTSCSYALPGLLPLPDERPSRNREGRKPPLVSDSATCAPRLRRPSRIPERDQEDGRKSRFDFGSLNSRCGPEPPAPSPLASGPARAVHRIADANSRCPLTHRQSPTLRLTCGNHRPPAWRRVSCPDRSGRPLTAPGGPKHGQHDLADNARRDHLLPQDRPAHPTHRRQVRRTLRRGAPGAGQDGGRAGDGQATGQDGTSGGQGGWAPTLTNGNAARRRTIVRKCLTSSKVALEYEKSRSSSYAVTFTAYYVSGSAL